MRISVFWWCLVNILELRRLSICWAVCKVCWTFKQVLIKKHLWLLQTINSESGRDSSSEHNMSIITWHCWILGVADDDHSNTFCEPSHPLRLWFSLWTSAVLCSADAGRFWAVLWRWWSTLHAPVGVKLLGQQTWNQKASVLPVPQFLPPALIFRPEGRLTANNNSRLLSLSCRQKHCSSKTVPQIHADVSAPTRARVRRVIGSVWILWFFALLKTSERHFALDEFNFHYRTCRCWWRTWDQSRPQDNIFARTNLDFISRPVQNHHGLIPQRPGPVSIFTQSQPLKVLVLSLFPPSCYNGGVFLWLEVLRTEDKVHCSNQEASRSSKQLIHICGVFRGSGF